MADIEPEDLPLLPTIPHVIGVTGHRDITNAEEARVRPFLVSYFEEHVAEYPLTPLRLLSGLAEGADRIVAKVFIEVRDRLAAAGNNVAPRWELTGVLPFAETAYRDDFPDSQAEFDELLTQTSCVVTATDPSAAHVRTNEALRAEGYEALGYHMLRHCSMLIALWDGIHLDLKGGTSHVVRMKLDGHENPDSAFALHDCGPVLHIPVRRARQEQSLNVGQPEMLYPNSQLQHGQGMTAARQDFKATKAGLDRFNKAVSIQLSGEDIRISMTRLAPQGGDDEGLSKRWLEALGPLDSLSLSTFGAADMLACKLDLRRRQKTKLLYGLGILLAIALWTALDGVAQLWMTAAYLTLLASIVLVLKRLRQSDLADDQLDYRFLAETLRIQSYWRLLDASPENDQPSDEPDDDASGVRYQVLTSLLSQQAIEIGWIREALRICGSDPTPVRLARDSRARLLHFWVQDQHTYFLKTAKKYEKKKWQLGTLAIACGLIGLVAASCVILIDQGFLDREWRHMCAISAAVLPAISLLLQSYSDRMALQAQAKNMARMSAVFGRFLYRLNKNRPNTMPRAQEIHALGEEALTENVNWLVLRRSRPASMPV